MWVGVSVHLRSFNNQTHNLGIGYESFAFKEKKGENLVRKRRVYTLSKKKGGKNEGKAMPMGINVINAPF